MVYHSRWFRLIVVVMILAPFFALGVGSARSAGETPGGEEIVRQTSILVSYTRYEWWLLRWSTGDIVCQVFVDHENLPSAEDISLDCSGSVYNEWMATPACAAMTSGSGDTSTCAGLYLYYLGSAPAEKTIVVDLPAPEVWVSLGNCEPSTPENLCPVIPTLVFTAHEPLPNEQITSVTAVVDNQTFTCVGSVCEVPLKATSLTGVLVTFWADSSFGDSSEQFTAQVRVIDSGVTLWPSGGGWYVDVLSTQWMGREIASCAQAWSAFPPVGGPPTWLQTPVAPELLATDVPFAYLAGRLIAQGLVDALGCPGGGLLANGYADACGVDAALPQVVDWQNRFDEQLLAVAAETGVPAQLMKNMIAQESQFWPGMFRVPYEFGLGQITDNGAEALLLWNPDFYEQFCPLVLDASACADGYIYLDAGSQAILRGALASQSASDGIDLSNVDFSINLFAHTLLANCEQVGQIMYNATGGKLGGQVSSYEELWRFTVANYHIGPGCLSYAMYKAWAARVPMDWEHVSDYLTEPCQSVIPYVANVTGSP